MNKVSTLLLILVIILAVLVASGVIYFYSETAKLKNEIADQKTRLENLGNQILEKEQTISDLTAKVSEYEGDIDAKVEYLINFPEYSNETIGLSFNYPKDLGSIIFSEGHETGQEEVAKVTLGFNALTEYSTFLHTVRDVPIGDRGGYWGDQATFIKDLEYINNFCEEKESCTIFTTANGITVAKLTDTTAESEGYSDPGVDEYHIFHPDSEYFGIVISTHALLKAGIENEKQIISDLVESLKFL